MQIDIITPSSIVAKRSHVLEPGSAVTAAKQKLANINATCDLLPMLIPQSLLDLSVLIQPKLPIRYRDSFGGVHCQVHK